MGLVLGVRVRSSMLGAGLAVEGCGCGMVAGEEGAGAVRDGSGRGGRVLSGTGFGDGWLRTLGFDHGRVDVEA